MEHPPPKADSPPARAVREVEVFTVYVIESLKNGKRYVGFTSKPVNQRLNEHNRGCNKWRERIDLLSWSIKSSLTMKKMPENEKFF